MHPLVRLKVVFVLWGGCSTGTYFKYHLDLSMYFKQSLVKKQLVDKYPLSMGIKIRNTGSGQISTMNSVCFPISQGAGKHSRGNYPCSQQKIRF